jgi:hypothetical protein
MTKEFRPFGFVRSVPTEVTAKHFKAPLSPASLTQPVFLVNPTSDEAGQSQIRGLLIAACLADETASASTPRTNGMSAFTYCLSETLNRLGPNQSTLELLQATGEQLKALGFRQTPVVKEPIEPEHLGSKLFLSLQPSLSGTDGEDALVRSITEAIRNILNTLKKESAMQPTQPMLAADQKGWFDDVTRIVTTVIPAVVGALNKDFQPQAGAGWQSGRAPQEKLFGIDDAILIPVITSAVAAAIR